MSNLPGSGFEAPVLSIGHAGMEWLFERMIEAAAWVAFILGLVFLFDAGYLLVQAIRAFFSDLDREIMFRSVQDLLVGAGTAGAKFVLAALALGTLACIDRYVFDTPAPGQTSA